MYGRTAKLTYQAKMRALALRLVGRRIRSKRRESNPQGLSWSEPEGAWSARVEVLSTEATSRAYFVSSAANPKGLSCGLGHEPQHG
jgi:hypothetical protein